MHESGSYELSDSVEVLARLIGCFPDELLRCCIELKNTGTADVTIGNGCVTLKSRRLEREHKSKELSTLRVQKHRRNADVTPMKRDRVKSIELRDKNISDVESDVAVGTASPTTATTAKKAKPKLSDQEWLESLKTKPAYKNLNIEIEYSRAEVWADANNRQCTRRFFTNWLNRAKPMETNFNSNGNGNHQFNKPSQMQQPRNELEFQKMLGEQKPK